MTIGISSVLVRSNMNRVFLARPYSRAGIESAFKGQSTASILKEKAVLTVLGNPSVSRPLAKVASCMPNGVLDSPPVSWLITPIISQFGSVNRHLETVLQRLGPNDVADLAKEGLAAHEDPGVILNRHLTTISHPNVSHMALKLSSFVPHSLLQSGIETPAYLKGLAMMTDICRVGQRFNKKIYIDAEDVPSQRLIDKAQERLAADFNDTVYLTFQSMRSDNLVRLAEYLKFCCHTGNTPMIKQVKGAYHAQESRFFPQHYNHTFDQTHATFIDAVKMVDQFPGPKHQFIGTMNPVLMTHFYETLQPGEYVLANLKGMEVGPSLGIPTLIYHPIALTPSELIQYGIRRLIELGNPENLTDRRLFVVSEALRQRLGGTGQLSHSRPLNRPAPLTIEHQVDRIVTWGERAEWDSLKHRALDQIVALVQTFPESKGQIFTPACLQMVIRFGNGTFKDPWSGIVTNPLGRKVEDVIELVKATDSRFDSAELTTLLARLKSARESAEKHPGF